MSKEVYFYRMTPQDILLSSHDKKRVWCLAEVGKQYLVFAAEGKPFSLNLTSGNYTDNTWVDAKTGITKPLELINQTSQKSVAFTPPDTKSDWVLLLRTESITNINHRDFDQISGKSITVKSDSPGYRRIPYSLNGTKMSLDKNRVCSGIIIIEESIAGEKRYKYSFQISATR